MPILATLVVAILGAMVCDGLLARAACRLEALLLVVGSVGRHLGVTMRSCAQITVWGVTTALVKPRLVANNLS